MQRLTLLAALAFLSLESAVGFQAPGVRSVRIVSRIPTTSMMSTTPTSTALSAIASPVQVTAMAPASGGKTAKERLQVGLYFGLWYAFNIGYNIFNKKALNMAPNLTWTVGIFKLMLSKYVCFSKSSLCV